MEKQILLEVVEIDGNLNTFVNCPSKKLEMALSRLMLTIMQALKAIGWNEHDAISLTLNAQISAVEDFTKECEAPGE